MPLDGSRRHPWVGDVVLCITGRGSAHPRDALRCVPIFSARVERTGRRGRDPLTCERIPSPFTGALRVADRDGAVTEHSPTWVLETHPRGMPAHSRWLSAATSPEPRRARERPRGATPTALRPPAQGWPEGRGPTLGNRNRRSDNRNAVAAGWGWGHREALGTTTREGDRGATALRLE